MACGSCCIWSGAVHCGERDSVEICAGKKCGRSERGAVSEAEQPNAGDGVQQPAFGETGKD